MKERTEGQIRDLRNKARHKAMKKFDIIDPEFSCDECDIISRCRFAYDIENLDGNCKAF
jgi:hypothetical protein